jgi:hypothetical protein
MSDTKTPAKPKISPEEAKAMIAALNPEQGAKLAELLAKGESKSRRMSEEDILSDYPLVIKDAFDKVGGGKETLRWNAAAGKQEAMVRCGVDKTCKETRIAFTSDLFQVKACLTHRKEQRKAARQNRNAERDALIEAGKAALAKKQEEAS